MEVISEPIQRWYVKRAYCVQHDTGDFVLAADAEADKAAAVAAAYELGRTDGILLGEEKAHRDSVIVHEGAAERRGYAKGQRDERARIRAGVEAFEGGWASVLIPSAAVLAVIDAAPQDVSTWRDEDMGV
jgi:hypothetical protein